MEERTLRVMFAKSGSGSITTRMTIPYTWVKELGITEDEREVNVTFDGKEIRISKKQL